MLVVISIRCIVAFLLLNAVSAPVRAEFLTPFWISKAGHDAEEHDVAVPPNGAGAAFVWKEVGNPSQIKGRTFSSTNVLGPVLRISRPNHSAFDGQVVTSGEGDFWYAWNEWKGGTKTRKLEAGS